MVRPLALETGHSREPPTPLRPCWCSLCAYPLFCWSLPSVGIRPRRRPEPYNSASTVTHKCELNLPRRWAASRHSASMCAGSVRFGNRPYGVTFGPFIQHNRGDLPQTLPHQAVAEAVHRAQRPQRSSRASVYATDCCLTPLARYSSTYAGTLWKQTIRPPMTFLGGRDEP